MRKLVTAAFAITLALTLTACNAQESTRGPIPPPKVDVPLATTHSKATAVFAGGCFWGTQAVFERVRGVRDTTAGYAGGSAATAHYSDVTTETTGHAESVQVIYDPAKLTYGQLLRIFFTIHDPTTLNRQGPDVGTSYRSAIFFTTPDQKRLADAYIAQLTAAHVFPHPIVTQVVPLKAFYAGEDYHQDYALNHPDNPYIMVCDRPKIATLKQDYPNLYVEYHGK
ncbi:MAG: peptide-methionine (S)-S-oxide reductase MsrA [Acidobacteriaceae bacterium]